MLLGVAVLAPLAIAGDRPDDRADRTSVGTLSTGVARPAPTAGVGVFDAASEPPFDAQGSLILPTRPDDRSGKIGVGAVEAPVPSEPVASTGRDWSDPTTVGSIAAVVALLGVVVVYGVEHWRGGGGGVRGTPGTPTAAH